MRYPHFLPLLVCLLATSARAAEPSPPVPNAIESAKTQQAAAREAIGTEFKQRREAAQKWFTSQLGALETDYRAKGDLDAVLAVKKERERADLPLAQEERRTLPLALAALRTKYDAAISQIGEMQLAKEAQLLRAYLTSLDALQRQLTQKGDLEAAVAAKNERIAAAKLLPPEQPAPAIAALPPQPAATPTEIAPPVGSDPDAKVIGANNPATYALYQKLVGTSWGYAYRGSTINLGFEKGGVVDFKWWPGATWRITGPNSIAIKQPKQGEIPVHFNAELKRFVAKDWNGGDGIGTLRDPTAMVR